MHQTTSRFTRHLINRESVFHRSAFTDCYALNSRQIVINIHTGKEIKEVDLIHDDPYTAGILGSGWKGRQIPMALKMELKYEKIFSAIVEPPFKREQYYFRIWDGEEEAYLFEDDLYTEEELNVPGRFLQYFKFPWLNESDVARVPDWVSETIWYQIMPDRFCRGNLEEKRMPLKSWNQKKKISWNDFFGGDLQGILSKLDYLKELGINGIYFTPLFESTSNHKYNTTDYTKIDPDFGTNEDMKTLVLQAHKRGIRIMIDAVFNHSGTDFFAWQDVLEKGEESLYYDWYYINDTPIDKGRKSTKDGRYYSFAFVPGMPKLNTNNPQVAEYLTDLCRSWILQWDVDGIRFDVGNEISHTFVRHLRRELKTLKPDLFLLGEIWHDSVEWLLGDEYDSVMNYPFLESLHNFWIDTKNDAEDFMYAVNRCYSMYKEQTNRVLFNFLDSHDIGRVYSRFDDIDIFFQQFTVLLSMQGSPCLYYGTEIAMEGKDDPDNRRCMPWDEIDEGRHDQTINEVKKIIALRKKYSAMKSGIIVWKRVPGHDRFICYEKIAPTETIIVMLNACAEKAPLKEMKFENQSEVFPNDFEMLYSRCYEDGILRTGGIFLGIKLNHNSLEIIR